MSETPNCPNCEQILRERGLNSLRNIRLRSIGNDYDKYVCENCRDTYSSEDVFDEPRTNIKMKKWISNDR